MHAWNSRKMPMVYPNSSTYSHFFLTSTFLPPKFFYTSPKIFPTKIPTPQNFSPISTFYFSLPPTNFSQPWDILNHDPWKKDNVKFIPFHGFLRRQLANQGCKHGPQSRCLLCKSLDPPSYKVKPCLKHPPYPIGICTDCKPSECRIDSQVYRHVDNVEFQVTGNAWYR
jgi:hypothetical protein